MRFIPTSMHAATDYTIGILLIAAPWIFGFADESRAATAISIAVGVAIIGLSAITNYEGGFLARAIPMPMHLATDALAGIFLAVSPWLFGFADEGANAWLPFVVIGIVEIGSAAMTETSPGEAGARRRTAGRAT